MNNNNASIKGVFSIKEFSKESGELLYSYEEENVITELGMNTLFLRMTMDDPSDNMGLSNFVIGIDTGEQEEPNAGWTQFDPKPAQKDYTTLNQYAVYNVDPADMVIDYPSQNQLQAGTLLDGEFILNSLYPDDPDVRYTSATFRFKNSTTFSYKRFPVRSLSRLIDVQIVWTFTFENAEDYACPIPASAAQLFTYYLNGSILVRSETMALDFSSTGLSVNDFSVLPNGDIVALTSATNITRYDENLNQLESFSVASSSMTDAHPNGSVIVAGGSTVRLYRNNSIQWSRNVGSTVDSIWIVDQNRLLVSSDDKLAMVAMSNGVIIYQNEFSAEVRGFSSTGGELFASLGGSSPALLKIAFDLSVISSNPTSNVPKGYAPLHDNNILYSDGGNVISTTADLESLWNRNISSSDIEFLTSDRERNIIAASSNTLYRLNETLNIQEQEPVSSPSKVISVGDRWGLIDMEES